jgi:hypothetical protein
MKTKRLGTFMHFQSGVIVAALLFLNGGLARSAAAYTIELSAAQFSSECNLPSNPGLRTVYIRETFNLGSMATRFKLALATGATITYVSETHPYTSVGNTQSGISICYGSCVSGSILVATVTYMSTGTDQNCSQLLVVPHPNAETVEILTCDGIPTATFNRDLNLLSPGGVPCGCSPSHMFPGTPHQFDCMTIATKNSTWGSIKALYR